MKHLGLAAAVALAVAGSNGMAALILPASAVGAGVARRLPRSR